MGTGKRHYYTRSLLYRPSRGALLSFRRPQHLASKSTWAVQIFFSIPLCDTTEHAASSSLDTSYHRLHHHRLSILQRRATRPILLGRHCLLKVWLRGDLQTPGENISNTSPTTRARARDSTAHGKVSLDQASLRHRGTGKITLHTDENRPASTSDLQPHVELPRENTNQTADMATSSSRYVRYILFAFFVGLKRAVDRLVLIISGFGSCLLHIVLFSPRRVELPQCRRFRIRMEIKGFIGGCW